MHNFVIHLNFNFKTHTMYSLTQKIKFPVFISIFLLVILQVNRLNANIYQVGEELEYEVRFLGIRLGTIQIISEGIEQNSGKDVFKAKSIIKSSDGIPFVSLYTIFESWFDTSITHSYRFKGNTKFLSDNWSYHLLLFDYKRNRIISEKWENKRFLSSDTIQTRTKWNDGLSLFFLARQFVDARKNYRIPTFMGDDTTYTELNFLGKRENIKINAVNYPVKTIFFNGNANWEGVYGLTGRFEGWFSDDEARIPIRAKMKVLVGNVSIELIKWNRKSWNPTKS